VTFGGVVVPLPAGIDVGLVLMPADLPLLSGSVEGVPEDIPAAVIEAPFRLREI
jgi:hypothetical protein